MSRVISNDIANLSPEDRITLIGELWDSLADADLTLTASQSEELAKRLNAFEADPSRGVAWAALKAELEDRCP